MIFLNRTTISGCRHPRSLRG